MPPLLPTNVAFCVLECVGFNSVAYATSIPRFPHASLQIMSLAIISSAYFGERVVGTIVYSYIAA
jgi:hypothetical protein